MIGLENVLYVCVGVRHILPGFKFWLVSDRVESYPLTPVLFAVYIVDPLIARLRSLGLGCIVLDEFLDVCFMPMIFY